MYRDDFLLRMAIGDAVCAAVEFVDDPALLRSAARLEGYGSHPRHRSVPGTYTDDTQMSVGVAEVLLSGDLGREAFAAAFVRVFARDVRRGYARSFYDFLLGCRDGDDFLRGIRPTSAKIGGGMRAVPLGVLPDPGAVVRIAELQSGLTHDTPRGRFAGIAVALMSHWAIYCSLPQHTMLDCFDFVMGHLPGYCRGYWGEIESGDYSCGTVKIIGDVFNTLAGAQSFTDVLRDAIRCGGDTDTTAAIAGGISAFCPFISGRLLEWMPRDLEVGGAYGPAFLVDLGRQLGLAHGLPRGGSF